MSEWGQPRSRGPARLMATHAETGAGIALATSAAHAADWVKNVPPPQGDTMLWICVGTLIFGFAWASFRLVRPRRAREPRGGGRK